MYWKVIDNYAMAKDTETVAARRQRLREWIAERFSGSQVAFLADAAKRGQRINQGELSGLLRSKPFGERRAIKLEKQAAMPDGYLAHPLAAVGTTTDQREIREVRAVVSLLAGAMGVSIPSAGLEFLDALDQLHAPEGSFANSIANTLRDQLAAARNRTRK